ncbi:hypothetical protein FXO38_34584 [Capsicum annuum]|nr:hypothetical protein FXO38_34584 [Capsicum annuum]KAF3616885.1 hypothetical protein FXO37_34890 [Capsicum annuum]
MFFYLTTLSLQRFTSEDAPEVPEGTSYKENFMIVEAWKHLDFLCWNYILSGLQDDLYNVNSLIVNDAFQVAVIIEKLPPMWEEFKNYLKHKHKEMTVEDLIVRLHIEEDNKAAERISKENSIINEAHVVEGNKPLGSKWIFKRKMKTDGTIGKYKARLGVKVFNQKEGLDYFDTYSPVTKTTSIRILIALAVVHGLEIHQMDVKTAFLNGKLEEEIYKEQPKGFMSKFDMKELGVVDVILGIRIHKTPQGLALSQSHYIENVLDKFKYMEFGIANTPLDVSFELRKNEVAPVCIHCDSQVAIGRALSIMYNGKSRHIRWRHNTVRELLSSRIITVDYVKSKDNVSDPLTKGLSRERVERTSKGMGLRPRTSQHGDSTMACISFSNHPTKQPTNVLDSVEEGFQKSIEDWRQTQPASEDGTMVQPSPGDMTRIWTTVVGGPKKGKTYGLGVNQSLSHSSPMLPNSASISQNTEEMKVMRIKIEELTQHCPVSDAKFAKFEALVKKHMPQIFEDGEDSESDD